MHLPTYVPPMKHRHTQIDTTKMFYSWLLCIINHCKSLKNLEKRNPGYGLNVKYYLIPLNNNQLPSSRTPKIFTKEILKIPTGQERKWDC